MSETANGSDELDAALAAVEELDEDTPLPVHVERFEHVHELLQRRLGEAEPGGMP